MADVSEQHDLVRRLIAAIALEGKTHQQSKYFDGKRTWRITVTLEGKMS